MTAPSPAVPATVLRLNGVTKRFGGVHALRGVSLDVREGEIVGLAGANGAGKSTLIKILTGNVVADSGDIELRGTAVRIDSARRAQQLGIGVVSQELDLVPDLTVAENIFLGQENRFARAGVLDRSSMRARARELLARVGLDVRVDRRVSDLAIGDRQLVAAARALRDAAQILLLDEPTSSLTPFEAARLFSAVTALRDAGTSVVFISHRLDEVLRICSRVWVLRDGGVVGQFPAEAAHSEALVEAMLPGSAGETVTRERRRPGAVVLDARGLRLPGRDPVDLTVRAGEVLGIFGLVGSGRSSLGRAVAGLVRAGGTMLLDGTPYSPRDSADAYRRGVASLSEDRRGEGILPALSVWQNVVVRGPRDTAPYGILRRSAISALVSEFRESLRIKMRDDRIAITALSGGNQQKVLLARLIAERLRLLVLDEPTHGIDLRAKRDLLATIARLSEQGIGIILISAELPELIASSDRIVVMRAGSIVAEFPSDAVDEGTLMAVATGATEAVR